MHHDATLRKNTTLKRSIKPTQLLSLSVSSGGEDINSNDITNTIDTYANTFSDWLNN